MEHTKQEEAILAQAHIDFDFWSQGDTEGYGRADLLDSTPRQIWLQRQLGLPTPAYMHLPLVLGQDGSKLSKRESADPVRNSDPAVAVFEALSFLGQKPPTGLKLGLLWDWAIDHWRVNNIPRQSICTITR